MGKIIEINKKLKNNKKQNLKYAQERIFFYYGHPYLKKIVEGRIADCFIINDEEKDVIIHKIKEIEFGQDKKQIGIYITMIIGYYG